MSDKPSRLFAGAAPTVTSDKPASIPRPPSTCLIADCNCPVGVLLLEVEDEKNKLKRGPAGKFCNGSSLRGGFSFKAWYARCWDHFYREQWRSGTARWQPVYDANADISKFAHLNPLRDGGHICEEELEALRKAQNAKAA